LVGSFLLKKNIPVSMASGFFLAHYHHFYLVCNISKSNPMKKLFLFAAICLLKVAATAQTYCTVSFPGGVAPITEVRLGYQYTHLSSATSALDHENFTGTTDTVYAGYTYTVVVMGSTGGNFTDSVIAFFDWNQNGSFNDVGERAAIGTIAHSTGNILQAAIANVTISQNLGVVRMRVIKKRAGGITSCNNTGVGQAEDYTLFVQQGFQCVGMPNPGIATISNNTCPNLPVVLSVSNFTAASSLLITWERDTSGLGMWFPISGATTSTYIVPSAPSNASYRANFYCPFSPGFTVSNTVSTLSYSPNFTTNSPVCIGDSIVVSATGCPNCALTITGPGGFFSTQPFSIPNASQNATGWYVYTSTESTCNFTHTDSFYVRVDNCQDSVWPGDVNYDKITNYLDFLYLFAPSSSQAAYSGPARKNASISYTGQACPDWGASINNVNRKHADCNGDGAVDFLDTMAINLNYNIPHPKGTFTPKPKIASQPDLFFDAAGVKFFQNTTVTIPISIGSPAYPVYNMMGIGTELKAIAPYDLNLALTDVTNVFGSVQQQNKFKRYIGSAQMDFVYSRYNAGNVGVYGPICDLSFTLSPNSAGDTITLYFDNEKILSNSGTALTAYNVIPLTFVVEDPLSIKENEKIRSAAIIPNPSEGNARLEVITAGSANITAIATDMVGRAIWQSQQANKTGSVSFSLPTAISSGIYLITLTADGEKAKVLKWIKH